jgi:hypothetical protein
MIQAIAVQAVYLPSSGTVGPSVRQVMFVPAAKMRWARTISASHPKKVWGRTTDYSYDKAFSAHAVDNAMTEQFDERHMAQWHLTGDPVGFQITDDEYLALVDGTMPRNVALRFQRAMEARGQVVIGSKAVADTTVFRYAPLHRVMSQHHLTTGERLAGELRALDTMVEDDNTTGLNKVTPGAACARGAGPHRNSARLPVRSSEVGTREPEAPVVPVIPTPVAPAPVVTTTGAKAVKPGDKIIAADGQVYVARKVDADQRDLSDVELFRRAYAESMNVMLLGEPGTGKTRGLVAAFPDAIVVPITGDTEVSDLVGTWVPTGPDSFVWVDGPLLKAMDEGRMLVMDEGGMADSKVLALLYPLMDKKGAARKLLVTSNPARGTVTAKDGFGIAFTSNPNAKGVHIAEPLLSRCAITMTVTTDYAVMRSLGCNERLVQAAEHMSKQRENGEMGWAPEARTLLDARDLEAKFGLVMALRAVIMQAPEMEREVVEVQLRERFGDLPGAAKKIKALGI